MQEPIRYSDWCKSRLEWDEHDGWKCTNPKCRFDLAAARARRVVIGHG